MEDEVKELSLEIFRKRQRDGPEEEQERKCKKLGDQSRGSNIQLIAVLEIEKGENKNFKEIIQENFPGLNTWVSRRQGPTEYPTQWMKKIPTSRLIIIV